jgi:hypothetical protein
VANGASSILDGPVAELLLSRRARTPAEPEKIYLEAHGNDIIKLVESPFYPTASFAVIR